MQKRLLGILATVVIIAAACGGATTSSAPAASPRRSPAPGLGSRASAPPTRPNLADEQVLRLSLGNEDPDSLDPAIADTSPISPSCTRSTAA